LDQKTGYDQECNSNLAKPADHSDIMIKTVYQCAQSLSKH
jgi:hypothetical protein